MSLRRILHHLCNIRIGIKSVLLLILACLAIHTVFLVLIRNGYLLSSRRPGDAIDKKRDVAESSEKHSNISSLVKSLHDGEKELYADIKSKPVSLNEIVRNLAHLASNRSTDDYNTGDESVGASDSEKASDQSQHHDDEKHGKESVTERAKAVEKTTEELTKKSCIRYVSIYSPRMAPFHYWREYVNLEQAFKEAKEVNSSRYDSRIVQHREFPSMFIECPGYRCDVALRPTADERFLARSDAVMINMVPQEVRYKMPKLSERLIKNLPRRVKVFFYAMECPLMMSHWDDTLKDIQYHYTMTYHSDSDVYFPYGQYVPGEPMDTEVKNFAENKTGLLVWTASNCNKTFWPRLEWVRNLEKLVDFDTYGKCGKLTCLPPLSPICTRQQRVYKFYLALENAPCDEYVSEKVWTNSLMTGLVPIVYGGRREAYERVLPPNSFIHVSDFASQQELVDYLKMIDKNDNLYNEFFAWRREGRVEQVYPDLYPESFCRVLPKLSKYSSPPVKKIGDSKYFQSCRGGPVRNRTAQGDIHNWSPWR
ncbi:uncharacterized protein LOC588755 [Strongylocentrotus purpuratus]|uniref:Fucosyltransferase n=1 Tax=Strongylocentrotus purpuratus TaxID=7668 RepID=A0A7M7HK73_STRPU|nr:uncharacterized protein LOC588755 [Strongylocentrotus purpuratus]